MARWTSLVLGVINCPNLQGLACDFVADGFVIDTGAFAIGYCLYGLPNFVESYFDSLSFNFVVNLGKDTTICPGDSVILDAGNPTLSHNWSTADTTQTITVDTTATYWVIVADNAGCQVTDSVRVIVMDAVVAMAGPDTSICEGDNVQLNASGGINYSWSPPMGLNDTSITNPTATPLTTTTYQVIVSGCGTPDTAYVTVSVDACLSINELTIANTLKIYPNPFKDNTLIQYTLLNNADVTLAIYNILGKIVYTIVNEQQTAGNYQYSFSEKKYGLVSGIYMLKLKVDDKKYIVRLVKLD